MLKENTYLNRRVLAVIEKTKEDFPDLKLTVTTRCPVFYRYYSGCRITFESTPYGLSIQTNPNITGPAFCETALLKEETVVYKEELGYRDVIKHMTEESLENHLIFFFSKVQETAKTGGYFSLIKLDID